MKNLLILIIAVTLSGCSSITRQAVDTSTQVQTLLSTLLDPTFTGNYHAEEHNMYIDYTIDVQGISKSGDRWVFTYFEFSGSGHFPLTPGLAWKGDHHITLGKKSPSGLVP